MAIARTQPLVALIVLLATVAPATAAPLAPAKASQLVTLVGSNTSTGGCGGFAPIRFLDARLGPDGQTTALTIPAKKVLILKRGEASVSVPLDGAEFGLIVTSGPSSGRTLVDVRVDPNGLNRGKATFDFGDGVVIRPGQKLCFSAIGIGGNATVTFIRVHGFLASDN